MAKLRTWAECRCSSAVWDKTQTGTTRKGTTVDAKVIALRSRFVPDRIDAQVGDDLTIHVTNVEQTRDMIHGFGLIENNVNLVMDPGETNAAREVDEAGCVSVLLHKFLFGAAPGDAGLSGCLEYWPAGSGRCLHEWRGRSSTRDPRAASGREFSRDH